MGSRNRKLAFFAGLAFCITLIFVYGLRHWEWGLMDDLQFVNRSREMTRQFGLWRGIFEGTRLAMQGDMNWGLLRPGYWLYSSLIYLLPPAGAYFLRFVTFASILVLSLLIVKNVAQKADQRPAPVFYALLLAALLSIHPLYDTLAFISLQEYCGLLLALGGLCLVEREPEAAGQWGAALLFLMACWFKTPFVWLLLGVGLLNMARPPKRVFGVVCLLASLANIGVAAYLAAKGSYTSHATQLQLSAMQDTVLHFVKEFAVPALILGLVFGAALRYRRRESFATDRFAVLVAGAGLGYLVNLLPWGSPTYHMGPPAFLMCLGAFIFLAPRFELKATRQPALVAAALLSLVVCAHGVWKCVARDLTIQEMRDWALQLPAQNTVLAINGHESSGRLRELLELRSQGAWSAPVIYLGDEFENAIEGGESNGRMADYYIVFSDQGEGNPKFMQNAVARFPLATIYKLK